MQLHEEMFLPALRAFNIWPQARGKGSGRRWGQGSRAGEAPEFPPPPRRVQSASLKKASCLSLEWRAARTKSSNWAPGVI